MSSCQLILPAPDHEIAIALFGQSRQGRALPARTGTPTGRKGQSSKLGVGKVNESQDEHHQG